WWPSSGPGTAAVPRWPCAPWGADRCCSATYRRRRRSGTRSGRWRPGTPPGRLSTPRRPSTRSTASQASEPIANGAGHRPQGLAWSVGPAQEKSVLEPIVLAIHLLLALALIGLVLLHSGKGGGLSDMFGGATGATALGSA